MNKLSNKYFWYMIFVCVFGITISSLVEVNGLLFSVIYITLLVICYSKDLDELALAEYKTPSWVWVLFIPLYCIRRFFITKSKDNIIGLFLLIFALCGSVGYEVMKENNKVDTAINSAYCNTVTKINEKEQTGNSCLKVINVEQVTAGNYRGYAQMSNGSDDLITIKWMDDNTYYLNIPSIGG